MDKNLPSIHLSIQQGIGKSEFVKWLASPMPEYFIESAINPDDKDTYKRLMSKWIWEVGELGATTRKADREALKAFITMRDVTVRLPYGRYDTHGPAMASLVGTLNNEGGFMSDSTGNRRFLPCTLTEIDWRGYTKAVEPDQVWSEAYTLYLMGEPWQLAEDEKELLKEISEEYEIDDPIEGILKRYFEIKPDEPDWWIPTTNILEILEDPEKGKLKGNSIQNARSLAATMTKLGLTKKRDNNARGQRVNGYTGIKELPPIPNPSNPSIIYP